MRPRLWLSLLLLLVVTAPATVRAQPTGGAIYTDPAGRFTVPIPTNWRAEPSEGYVTLTDPDGAIRLYVLTVEAEDVEAGVAAAWRVVDPAFALRQVDATHTPPDPGTEDSVIIAYDPDDAQRAVVGLGQIADGIVYAVLIDGSTEAITRRGSQVQVILSGLTITGAERTDLTGVTPRPLTPDLLAQLEDYIGMAMARDDVPGAAVAIVRNGQVVYTRGFGVRERGTDAPVTPDTLMMIGSTGKTMTTMMMASVVDDGRMRWDEPVVDILPSFRVADPDITRRLTVRNLVCACTGVPRRDAELIFNANDLSAEDIIASLAGFRFFTGFGEAFQYSNQMVATGGYVTALAAGARYGDLYNGYVEQMQRRVFDPIGMTSTTYSFETAAARPDHATPYSRNLAGDSVALPLSMEALLRPAAPAGATWSTARDMARYLITQMNEGVTPDGRRVVSSANLRETWQPQVAVSADSSYGLGWFVGRYKGLRMLSHGGNTLGFTSDLAFLPDAGLGIVVLTNGRLTNAFNEAVRFRLLELVYGQPMEHDAQAAFAAESTRQAYEDVRRQLGRALDPAAVRPFLGSYTNDVLGDITLSLRDGRLLFDAGEFVSEVRVAEAAKGEAQVVLFDPPLAGTPLALKMDDDGSPTITLASATDTYVFRRRT